MVGKRGKESVRDRRRRNRNGASKHRKKERERERQRQRPCGSIQKREVKGG